MDKTWWARLTMIAFLLVATAAPVEAQVRRWVGVGMAAAGGVVAALTPTKCRAVGELGGGVSERVFDNRTYSLLLGVSGGWIDLGFENPRNPVAELSGKTCSFDWTVDFATTGRVWLFNRVILDESTREKMLASEARRDITRTTGDGYTGAWPSVDATRGSARAESYKPKGQLFGGLALAGAGAVLALLPGGGDQVRPTIDFRRREFGVQRSISW